MQFSKCKSKPIFTDHSKTLLHNEGYFQAKRLAVLVVKLIIMRSNSLLLFFFFLNNIGVFRLSTLAPILKNSWAVFAQTFKIKFIFRQKIKLVNFNSKGPNYRKLKSGTSMKTVVTP